MKKIKLFSFISLLISFAVSLLLSYIVYKYSTSLDSINKILSIPIAILIFILLICSLLSSIGTSISCIRSDVLLIRIFAIVVLILTIGLAVYDINTFIHVYRGL